MTGHVDGFIALMYHEIVPSELLPRVGRPIDVAQSYADLLPRPLFVVDSEFERQMRYIAEEGYHSLTMNELLAWLDDGAPLPERSILITVDDLYQSARYRVWPLLGELGLHATGFVVHDWIFNEPQPRTEDLSRTLAWEDLEAMRDVFAYANHAAALHTRSGKAAPGQSTTTGLTTAPRVRVISDAQRCAEDVDHGAVYAYPFGVSTEQTRAWLSEAGIRIAFTTRPGYNTRDTPRMELGRNGVYCDTTFDEFRVMVDQF